MLTSLAFIFLVGLFMAAICQRLKLPRIIGMLITGIVLGPYVLDLLDPSILSISADLRQMALIIILLKAGLSLNLADLKRVGRLHIAKLNGRLCGAKRPHSVSEQPNFYQSLQSNPYNDSSHPSGGE